MNLLPIGSVVLLKEANKRLMICGIMQKQENDEKIYDYIGCLYPEGYIDSETMYLFDHQDIERVDFAGFADAEFQIFRYKFDEGIQAIAEEKMD